MKLASWMAGGWRGSQIGVDQLGGGGVNISTVLYPIIFYPIRSKVGWGELPGFKVRLSLLLAST